MLDMCVSANQRPEKKNKIARLFRKGISCLPKMGLISSPHRPLGLSVVMRVKDERDWIRISIQSILNIANEIVFVDNGSEDGTYEIVERMAQEISSVPIYIWRKPNLHICELSNFAMKQTKYRWILRWDGDMVAQTSGKYNISRLKERIMRLDSDFYYLIYLCHINLAGDLFHQNPEEMVHIEEYIHTYKRSAKFVHPQRFEAIKFPKYYRPLFWYEPYAFHLDIKPANRMLLRYFWEEWMELKDYRRFPNLEIYVKSKIENAFGTADWNEAKQKCVKRVCANFVPYNEKRMGPYPKLVDHELSNAMYKILYQNGKIIGRLEPFS